MIPIKICFPISPVWTISSPSVSCYLKSYLNGGKCFLLVLVPKCFEYVVCIVWVKMYIEWSALMSSYCLLPSFGSIVNLTVAMDFSRSSEEDFAFKILIESLVISPKDDRP